MNANFKVEGRPVTQAGIAGIKTAAQGPGRTVIDKTYYIGQLRSKTDEIIKVLAKMKNDIDEIEKKNSSFSTLEKTYETLSRDVRNLEGQLADYNLASDKMRSRTKPDDILMIYEHVRLQNDKQRQVLGKG